MITTEPPTPLSNYNNNNNGKLIYDAHRSVGSTKPQCASTRHSLIDTHIIYTHTHTHTHTHNMVNLDLCECLSKEVILRSALKSDRVGRFRRLAGRKFQTDGAMKLNEHAHQLISICAFGLPKGSHLRIKTNQTNKTLQLTKNPTQ